MLVFVHVYHPLQILAYVYLLVFSDIFSVVEFDQLLNPALLVDNLGFGSVLEVRD